MMGHKICFYGEIWLFIPKLSLLPLLICSTDSEGFLALTLANFIGLGISPNELPGNTLCLVQTFVLQIKGKNLQLYITRRIINAEHLFWPIKQCYKEVLTLKCLNIGTPETINFPFAPNGKFMILGVPIFEHIIIRL